MVLDLNEIKRVSVKRKKEKIRLISLLKEQNSEKIDILPPSYR